MQTTHQVLAGYDPADRRSLVAGAVLPPFPIPPRVAFLPGIRFHLVDPRIAAAAERLAYSLAASGLTIEVPYDPDAVAAAWDAVASSGLSWHLAKMADWQDQMNPAARATAEVGADRTAADLLDALTLAGQVRQAAAALFAQFDMLLCPATAALAWPADAIFPPEIERQPVGPRGHAVFTGWMNVAGLPAATVQLAITEGGGIGAQVVAGHGRDLLAFPQASPVLSGLSPAALATHAPLPASTKEAFP